MGGIDSYWTTSAAQLQASFERGRAAHRDAAVKGSVNEGILAAFLRENTGAPRVALNSAIIDADDQRSDEIDVAVMNDNQPLWTGEHGQLLIAEGVDVVYQVKAQLTSEELRRAARNGRSVKRLLRPLGAGSIASATGMDGTRFIDHIPFFVFAYESKISSDTATRALADELDGSRWEGQPDGVFVLNDWSLVNVADNSGALKVGPPEASGFQMVKSPSSLATMMWCHHLSIRRIVHFTHPLQRYHPFVKLNGNAESGAAESRSS